MKAIGRIFEIPLRRVFGVLLISGLLEIYFLYFDNREQISQLQKEIATGAAFKIEQFIQEIEKTMRGATKSREVVLKGISPEYKFELQKLLLLAPPVTEAVAIGTALSPPRPSDIPCKAKPTSALSISLGAPSLT